MKIGVSAFAWTTRFTAGHIDLLSSLRDHGIESFEIGIFDPADLPTAAIRKAMEANELELSLCCILPAGINPISPDTTIRKRSRDHLVRCIATGAEMGAHLICGPVYAPIGYLPGRRSNAEEWNWAVEGLRSLGDELDSHRVTLAIEPVNRSETFLLNTAAEARELCEEIGHPRIGATIDTFHANIEEKSIPAAVRSLGPWLRHIHASENDRGVLGSGHVGLAETLQVLREIDYDGYIVLEGFGYSPAEKEAPGALWADPRVTPEDIALQGLAYLRSLGA